MDWCKCDSNTSFLLYKIKWFIQCNIREALASETSWIIYWGVIYHQSVHFSILYTEIYLIMQIPRWTNINFKCSLLCHHIFLGLLCTHSTISLPHIYIYAYIYAYYMVCIYIYTTNVCIKCKKYIYILYIYIYIL